MCCSFDADKYNRWYNKLNWRNEICPDITKRFCIEIDFKPDWKRHEIYYLISFSSDSIEGVYHQVEESEYCKLNLFDSLIEMEKQKEQVIGNNYVYETEINKKGLYLNA